MPFQKNAEAKICLPSYNLKQLSVLQRQSSQLAGRGKRKSRWGQGRTSQATLLNFWTQRRSGTPSTVIVYTSSFPTSSRIDWGYIIGIWWLKISYIYSLLAPKVLLDNLRPMITIPSHPIHPQSLFYHLNRPWIDLSLSNDLQWPPITANDYQWLPMTTNDYPYLIFVISFTQAKYL